LIRYTDQRMQFLGRMKGLQRSVTKLEDDSDSYAATVPEGKNSGEDHLDSMSKKMSNNGDCESVSQNGETENGDDTISVTSINSRTKTRPLRLKLSDDVAMAPPPCVISLGSSDANTGKPKIRLAYYAYNPNARFRRSNPGMPDFGVAVMPYHSDNDNGPTFGVLNSLVSMCEEGERPEVKEDVNKCSNGAAGGIPLRVVTVADGGAVIAFGVTNGDVPYIN